MSVVRSDPVTREIEVSVVRPAPVTPDGLRETENDTRADQFGAKLDLPFIAQRPDSNVRT